MEYASALTICYLYLCYHSGGVLCGLCSELMAWPWCLGLLSHAREHSRSNLPAIYLRVVSSVNFCNRYARLDEVQC